MLQNGRINNDEDDTQPQRESSLTVQERLLRAELELEYLKRTPSGATAFSEAVGTVVGAWDRRERRQELRWFFLAAGILATLFGIARIFVAASLTH